MTAAQSLPPLLALTVLWAGASASLLWRWRLGKLKRPYHFDLLAIGALGLANVGFFWQVLFDRAMMPNGGGDLASFLYPMYSFASQSLHAGRLPLWNPYLFSGMPFQADIQSGLFYPPNLLVERLARPFDYTSMEWLAMLHYWLAGVGLYLLVRTLGVTRLGALVGGLVWMWSGFMVAQLGHLNMVEVAVWLPLELLLLRLAILGVRQWLTVPITAAILAIAFFAGHTQLFLYELLALALFVAFWGAYRRSIPVLAVCLGGAAVLAAVQILPSFELTRLSLRAGISYQESTQFALAPAGLLTLLVPHFFGENAQNYWGSWTTTEVFGYAGILPLVLAAAALWLRPRRQTRYWLWISLFGLLLSLGSATVLQGWLYRFVPGFDQVRAPGRFLVFFDLGVAVLAATGFDAVRESRARTRFTLRRLRLLTGGAALAVGLAGLAPAYAILLTHQHEDAVIFHRLEVATSGLAILTLLLLACHALMHARRRWTAGFAAVAIGLVAVDLGSAGYNFNPGYTDVTASLRSPAVVGFLQSHLTGGARVDPATNVDDVLQPDLPLLAGIPSIWGLFNPVQLADYYDFWKAYVPGRGSSLYDLLGARYLVAKKDTPLDAKFRPAFTDDKTLTVYEDPSALPRAFAVSQAAGGTHAQALATIRAASFDPSRQAVLEGGPAIGVPPPGASPAAGTAFATSPSASVAGPDAGAPPSATGPVGAPASAARRASGEAGESGASSGESEGPWPASGLVDGGDRLAFDITLPRQAALVVTTPYYPGWAARVDGAPARVYRADFVFQGLVLPPGSHHVELRFEPPLFRLGAVISILGWLAALGAIAYSFTRRGRYA